MATLHLVIMQVWTCQSA